MENGLVSNVEGAWKLAKARHEIPLFSRTGIDRGHPHARTHTRARKRWLTRWWPWLRVCERGCVHGERASERACVTR